MWDCFAAVISLIPLGWGSFFFLMKQFQLLSQGPLAQTHSKHSCLPAPRNSESTGSYQRDTAPAPWQHLLVLFLVCVTLSPRLQVTPVTWFSASSPLAVFTWGKELHFSGLKPPQGPVTGLPSVSLPTCNPPRSVTDPPGGQGLMAVGPAFYHTFIFLSGHFRRRGT